MITILPNGWPYRDEHLDLLCCADWMERHLRFGFPPQGVTVPLSFLRLQPFLACAELAIDTVGMETAGAYRCGGTALPFHACVPVCLHPNSVEAALSYGAVARLPRPVRDMPLDAEWWRTAFGQHQLDGLPDPFQRAMMGSGHTAQALPSDGSSKVEIAHVGLSNGDALSVAVWHWFGK